MRTVKLGELDAVVVGDGPRTLVLCHGYGAPGDDLVGLAEALDPKGTWRWVFPAAPIDLRGQGIPGRAWWSIDMLRLQGAIASGELDALMLETPPGLDRARVALTGAIDALEREHGVARGQLVVGGFSQGAMLTTDVALHAEAPFAGLVVLSGTLIARERWLAAAAARAKGLAVFQSHGVADPILPFENAVKLRELLTAAGARVDFVEHGWGHELPPPALIGLRSWLGQR